VSFEHIILEQVWFKQSDLNKLSLEQILFEQAWFEQYDLIKHQLNKYYSSNLIKINFNWTNMIRAIWFKQVSFVLKSRWKWKKMWRRCRYCERRIKHKEGVTVRRIEPDFEECEWVFESFLFFGCQIFLYFNRTVHDLFQSKIGIQIFKVF